MTSQGYPALICKTCEYDITPMNVIWHSSPENRNIIMGNVGRSSIIT